MDILTLVILTLVILLTLGISGIVLVIRGIIKNSTRTRWLGVLLLCIFACIIFWISNQPPLRLKVGG